MTKTVVTGGAATGKSCLVACLKKILPGGAVVFFSSDAAVTRAYDDPPILAILAQAFGPSVIKHAAETGTSAEVDRAWLRSNVLPDAEKRERLEGILHPWVLRSLEEACRTAEAEGANLFVAEVPLHYEIGSTVSADLVIVVAASRSVQVRRMMENRGLDEHAVHAFLNAQWPIEAKAERADVVIWNDGDMEAFEAQVLALASFLRQS